VKRIQSPLLPVEGFPGQDILEPKALVRVGHEGRWSRVTLALIDTGSPVSIVSPDLAKWLGWEPQEGQSPVDLMGLGGNTPVSGWRAELDLAFVSHRTLEPELGLLLRRSVVFVSELVGRGDVLIGQHDALERLRFTQRNQLPYQDFELELSDEDSGL
jgi:hypothetical protein